MVANGSIGVVFQGGAGQETWQPNSPPYSSETVTWVASMTKLWTSVAMLQLVERNLLSLDQDIRPLVPEMGKPQILKGFSEDGSPVLEDNEAPITLR